MYIIFLNVHVHVIMVIAPIITCILSRQPCNSGCMVQCPWCPLVMSQYIVSPKFLTRTIRYDTSWPVRGFKWSICSHLKVSLLLERFHSHVPKSLYGETSAVFRVLGLLTQALTWLWRATYLIGQKLNWPKLCNRSRFIHVLQICNSIAVQLSAPASVTCYKVNTVESCYDVVKFK